MKYVIQTDHPLSNIMLNHLKTQITEYQALVQKQQYQYVDIFLIDRDLTHQTNQLFFKTIQNEIKLLNQSQQMHCYQWLNQTHPLTLKVIKRCFCAEIRSAMMYKTNWNRLTLDNYLKYCQTHPVNHDIQNIKTFSMYKESHIFELLQFIEHTMLNYLDQLERS